MNTKALKRQKKMRFISNLSSSKDCISLSFLPSLICSSSDVACSFECDNIIPSNDSANFVLSA